MSQLRARFRFLLLPAIAAASILVAAELVGNLYFVWRHGVFFYGSRAAAEEAAVEESIPGAGEIYSLAPYTGFRIRPGRFARLVSSGYFEGLTFHRVVTNFVLQGGSPGANEYSGTAAYTRDELGLVSHWRGTVATSTRGRDTGDGQIFINLVDNLRLNHDYTVFGEVVSGMDVTDQVAEGDVIVRASVVVPE